MAKRGIMQRRLAVIGSVALVEGATLMAWFFGAKGNQSKSAFTMILNQSSTGKYGARVYYCRVYHENHIVYVLAGSQRRD